MNDTSVHDADVSAADGGAPGDQTSRLPKIRRHDEFYTDHGMVGAPEPERSAKPDAAAELDSPDTTGGPAGAGPEDPAAPAVRPSDADTTALHPAVLERVAPVAPPAPVDAADRFQPPPASSPLVELAEPDNVETVRAKGAGWAAVLGVGGLATAAIGLFALPVQQQTGRTEIFFGQLRGAAAADRVSSLTGAHSTSLAGDQIATTFWRYGALGVIGGLAALLILTLAWGPSRRTGGALTFVGAVGALVYGALAAVQTNRYASALIDRRAAHMTWGDWKIGFWVGVGGLVLVAIAGLNALVGRRASTDDDL